MALSRNVRKELLYKKIGSNFIEEFESIWRINVVKYGTSLTIESNNICVTYTLRSIGVRDSGIF